jgi:cytochrome bd-type quinol oxidase subunit 1
MQSPALAGRLIFRLGPIFPRINTMTAEIITASISAGSAMIVAVIGYYLTKKREREAEWRSEKLGYYKAFVSSLSSILDGESSPEGQIAFAKSCNAFCFLLLSP